MQFTVKNNPKAEWAKKMYLTFADWFAGKGDTSLLPPKMSGQVTSIMISTIEDGINLHYGGVKVLPAKAINGERDLLGKIICSIEEKKERSEQYILYPADYYSKITEIINKYDLRPFDKISVLYGTGRNLSNAGPPAKATLKLHIKYKDGHQLNIDTSDPNDKTLLQPLLNELFDYNNSLF